MEPLTVVCVLLGVVLSAVIAALAVIAVLAVRASQKPEHQYVVEMVRLIMVAWERGAEHKKRELSSAVEQTQNNLLWPPEPDADQGDEPSYVGSHQSTYDTPLVEDEVSLGGEGR